ncbi:hypothetical protein BGY98DRAFT_204810 [Russula aff. rugulosa BPL654]|nr:hypothetical protein BGY98DRAFT_204810 [Russula aff. rugulosa BPL654]
MITMASVGYDGGRTVRLISFYSASDSPSFPLPLNKIKPLLGLTDKSNGTARFTGNPHVAAPSKRDLEPSVPIPHATFPIPLPPYLPRSAPLSATVSPTPDAKASNAGQFSLSKRGMRKALRRSGPARKLSCVVLRKSSCAG